MLLYHLIFVGNLTNPISLQYRTESDSDFTDYTWGEEATTSGKTGEGLKISLKPSNKVYFKGNNSSFNLSGSAYLNFKTTGKVKASGSAMSLVSDYYSTPASNLFNF